MILYFSGTGNSEYVARKIAEVVDDEVISLNGRIREKNTEGIKSEKNLVFVVPTYAWRIPRVVEQWIGETAFSGRKGAYFVMTCGDSNGNAVKYVRKLCGRKRLKYMGCVRVVMPENYITMFKAPERQEAIEVIKKAEPVIMEAAKRIKAGKRLWKRDISVVDRICSSLVNVIFYPCFVSAKKFYATDTCVGCGKCVSACPFKNVVLEHGKPKWGGRCTQCMACICGCPKEAIEYGKRTKGKVRYLCPYPCEEK